MKPRNFLFSIIAILTIAFSCEKIETVELQTFIDSDNTRSNNSYLDGSEGELISHDLADTMEDAYYNYSNDVSVLHTYMSGDLIDTLVNQTGVVALTLNYSTRTVGGNNFIVVATDEDDNDLLNLFVSTDENGGTLVSEDTAGLYLYNWDNTSNDTSVWAVIMGVDIVADLRAQTNAEGIRFNFARGSSGNSVTYEAVDASGDLLPVGVVADRLKMPCDWAPCCPCNASQGGRKAKKMIPR